MHDESWRRVEELFLAALDVPLEQRAAFLDRECGSDAALRADAESLLAADEGGGRRIAMLVEDSAANLLDRDAFAGRRLGPYQLVDEIGRGGMGAVYAAVRADREYEKRVAVKILKRGLDTDAVLERFRHERQILAGLDHPYITRLLDGGTSPDGLPYFVMELVDGRPIQDYCRDRKLSVRGRCELFLKVCEAVAYAHRNLVIHRDLKPANILVTAEGTPKLLDFGIARLLSLDPGENTVGNPEHSKTPLTPAYASPEQLRGDAVSTATDVYSLGAVLYEILSGHAPSSDRTDPHERNLPKPSEAAATRDLQRALSGDLDNIVLKATHPDERERYHSVDHLADDLQRYLSGLPVLARDDRFGYRARKFLWRHRVLAAAGFLVVASLTAGLAFSIAAQRKTQKRFDEVRALANSILFELHDEINKLPGATRARSMVLQKAITYLDGLAKDAAGDMSLQMELARAYVRVGELQSTNLGDAPRSINSFSKAVQIARAASLAAPADARGKLLLVDGLSGLGRQEVLTAQLDSGRRHLDESSRILEALIANGSSPGPEALEAAVRENIVLSGLARNEGEYLRALTALRRAARSVDLLRQAAPDKAGSWESLVSWNLAIVLSQTGDLQAAKSTLETATKISTALAERHPENAGYARQVWVTRQARALFAGSPRSINEGDYATSIELYREAEALHRRNFAADEANVRFRVDYIAANFGLALVTSEVDPEKGLALLQENLKLCQTLPPETLETNLSNFTTALVYRTAALTAAKLRRWSQARDYMSQAEPFQQRLLARKPYFLTRLEHATFLREKGAIEAGAGNRPAAAVYFHDALAEFAALADHRNEIFWVWRSTEALEGLAAIEPDASCDLYAKSVDAWTRWRAGGGADSSFFRTHLDRANQLLQRCR